MCSALSTMVRRILRFLSESGSASSGVRNDACAAYMRYVAVSGLVFSSCSAAVSSLSLDARLVVTCCTGLLGCVTSKVASDVEAVSVAWGKAAERVLYHQTKLVAITAIQHSVEKTNFGRAFIRGAGLEGLKNEQFGDNDTNASGSRGWRTNVANLRPVDCRYYPTGCLHTEVGTFGRRL